MSESQTSLLPIPSLWDGEPAPPRGPQYLTFDIGEATFALALTSVREVDRLPVVATVPRVPPWVLGVVNLRGELLSAVDLGAFLGLDAPRPGREARIVACRVPGMEAGLVVESMRDIREISDESLRPPSGPVAHRVARYISGVHDGEGRETLVLDVARLLGAPEFRRFA
ncbi:MAG: purine-binding chemotaxis protein CheW [Chloroflexi bacterium]|nr:purine-binding chemotaxis protein CheW [Chloroflexota bacterium]